MVFRVSDLQKARANDPEMWRALVRIAITKHKGVLKRAANDLDIGYSTLKRWVSEEAEFRKVVRAARK